MDFLKKMAPRWVITNFRKVILNYRKTNWRNRVLPDFLIIGAQKAGTTSLYSYLGQHPHLISSYSKEVHFFDGGLNPDVDNFSKGQAWYRANFPLKRCMGNDQIAFEASPLYIFNPLAPERISKLLPVIKLILVLRNPVERAVSHYFHEKRNGAEFLPITEALQAEEERLKPILARKDYKNFSFIHHSYKKRGLYYEQLARYLDYFPMSSILLLDSDTLLKEPNDTLQRVFEFVGVDPEFSVQDLKPRNVSSNRSEIDPDVYEYLENHFQPHNQQLYELVGKDFGWDY